MVLHLSHMLLQQVFTISVDWEDKESERYHQTHTAHNWNLSNNGVKCADTTSTGQRNVPVKRAHVNSAVTTYKYNADWNFILLPTSICDICEYKNACAYKRRYICAMIIIMTIMIIISSYYYIILEEWMGWVFLSLKRTTSRKTCINILYYHSRTYRKAVSKSKK